MKVRSFSRYSLDDFGEAPDWFVRKLDSENVMVDTLNQLLQNGIDLTNNIQNERQTVTVSHNVAVTIKPRVLIGYTPTFARVGYASGYVATANITSYNTDGTFQVKVFFHGTAPTSPTSVVLLFEV